MKTSKEDTERYFREHLTAYYTVGAIAAQIPYAQGEGQEFNFAKRAKSAQSLANFRHREMLSSLTPDEIAAIERECLNNVLPSLQQSPYIAKTYNYISYADGKNHTESDQTLHLNYEQIQAFQDQELAAIEARRKANKLELARLNPALADKEVTKWWGEEEGAVDKTAADQTELSLNQKAELGAYRRYAQFTRLVQFAEHASVVTPQYSFHSTLQNDLQNYRHQKDRARADIGEYRTHANDAGDALLSEESIAKASAEGRKEADKTISGHIDTALAKGSISKHVAERAKDYLIHFDPEHHLRPPAKGAGEPSAEVRARWADEIGSIANAEKRFADREKAKKEKPHNVSSDRWI